MNTALLEGAVLLAQLLLATAMICATIRLLRGPRAQDRVLALDTLYIIVAMLLLVFGIGTGSPHYFGAALLITLLGFVSTAALAKFLMRGEVIE